MFNPKWFICHLIKGESLPGLYLIHEGRGRERPIVPEAPDDEVLSHFRSGLYGNSAEEGGGDS